MCKYCEHIEDNTQLSSREFSKYNEGCYTGIEAYIEPNKLIIFACLDNQYIKPLNKEVEISINFCPMCCKKLNKFC